MYGYNLVYSPGCPRTHALEQSGLESHRDPPLLPECWD